MPAIRCKACGKTYDSREGFCPKCGAYNRPPRREWVDAGGDVHYAEQEKVCYEQKECHEEKVCYENQTRRPRPHIQWHVPKKNAASGAIGAVIAVSIVIVLINTLRGVSGDIFDRNEPTPDYGWGQVAPAEEIEAAVREYAELGAVFTLGEDEDDFTTVNDVWMDDSDLLHAIVTLEEAYQSFPSLCSMGSDGSEHWLWLEDIKDTDKGEYTFECVYDLSYAPHDNMWLVFYGVDKEVWVGIESTI